MKDKCPNVYEYVCPMWQNGHCTEFEPDPESCPRPVLVKIEKDEKL